MARDEDHSASISIHRSSAYSVPMRLRNTLVDLRRTYSNPDPTLVQQQQAPWGMRVAPAK